MHHESARHGKTILEISTLQYWRRCSYANANAYTNALGYIAVKLQDAFHTKSQAGRFAHVGRHDQRQGNTFAGIERASDGDSISSNCSLAANMQLRQWYVEKSFIMLASPSS